MRAGNRQWRTRNPHDRAGFVRQHRFDTRCTDVDSQILRQKPSPVRHHPLSAEKRRRYHETRKSRMEQGIITIADMSRERGFSPITVSRVISEEKNLKDLTRDAVIADDLSGRTVAGLHLFCADPIHHPIHHANHGGVRKEIGQPTVCSTILEENDAPGWMTGIAGERSGRLSALLTCGTGSKQKAEPPTGM
jgi:hypothetical protein